MAASSPLFESPPPLPITMSSTQQHNKNEKEYEEEEIVIDSQTCYDNTIVILQDEFPETVEDFLSLENYLGHFAATHMEEVRPAFVDQVITNEISANLFGLLALLCTETEAAQPENTSIVSFACRDCNPIFDIPHFPNEENDSLVAYEGNSHPHLDIKDVVTANHVSPIEEKLHQATLYLQLLVSLLGSSTLQTSEQRNILENQLLMKNLQSRKDVRKHSLKFFGNDERVMDPNVLPLVDLMWFIFYKLATSTIPCSHKM